MDIKDEIKKIENRDMSRRGFSKLLAAVGLTTAMIPMTQKFSHAADGEAIYYTWSGYDIPEIWPDYPVKHGAPPQTPVFGDTEEAFTKLRAGFQVDLSHPCSNAIVRWKSAGLLQPIDTSRLSNWKNVVPALQNLDGTTFDGANWFAPYEWGQTSITYRTDLFDLDGQEESWGMLWDERYKGRLAIIDAAGDSWWCAAIYAGVDLENLTEDSMAKVLTLLRQQQELLRFRQNDMTTINQALASGEIVAAMTWNDSPLSLSAEGVPVKFADVKEGALTWVCGTALHANAPHYDKAHDVIDAMLSVEAGVYCIQEFGYGHSNTKAFDAVSAEDLAARGLTKNPTDVLSAGVFQKALAPEVDQMIARDWADLISSI